MNALHWSWTSLVLAMIHSLWQSAIAAAVLWLLLRFLPAKRATLRYSIAVIALGITFLATMATWSILDVPRPATTAQTPPISAAGVVDSGTHASMTPAAESSAPASAAPSPIDWAAATGWTWLGGALFMLLRTAAQITSAERLVRSGRPTRTGPLAAAVADVAAKLHLRRAVRIVVHENWNIPAVVGCFWPTLLLPASIAGDCPAWQLQFIIAHELAHIRRFDFLVNICQQVVEAVLFFNPAVWWISRQIRIEREACCDAVAVRLAGSQEQAAATLAHFGSRLFAPTVAMTLVGRRRGGGQLLDRIRRIIFPQARPWISAPWYGSAAVIVIAIAIFGVLRVGAGVAVATVQNLLISSKDLAAIAAAQKTVGPSQVGSEREELPLRGTVRTVDGAPLPRASFVHVSVDNPGNQWKNSKWLDPSGRFAMDIPADKVSILVVVPGYAPTSIGPLFPDQHGKLPPMDIMVDRGFTTSIAVTDRAGRPIPQAQVNLQMFYQSDTLEWVRGDTGTDGSFAIAGASSAIPFQATVIAPGFEFTQQQVQLDKVKPTRIAMAPAKVTSGIVCDAASGRPIAGAAVRMLQRSGFADRKFSPSEQTLSTTDSNGRFVLDTLRADSQYEMLVMAPGHGGRIIPMLHAGQVGLRWALGPPWEIHGRVTGDLSQLQQDNGRPVLRFDEEMDIGDTAFIGFDNNESDATPVLINHGVGTFDLRTEWPAQIRIDVPNAPNVEVDTADLPSMVEINLPAPPKPPMMRPVVFQFDVPAGAPPPRGKLLVWKSKPDIDTSSDSVEIPVTGDTAQVDLPVPVKVNYSGDEILIGYWVETLTYGVVVPPGSGKFIIHVPVVPAGAVRGRVLEVDGLPCHDFTVSRYEIVKSPLMAGPRGTSPFLAMGSPDGAFLLTPVPLGGTYKLFAQDGDRLAFSDALAIDGQHPLRETTLRFSVGLPVQVNVVDADGHPRAGVAVSLTAGIQNAQGFGGKPRATDRAGTVVFEHINPAQEVDYRLTVDPGDNYPGTTVPIRIDGKPVTIRLQPGLSLTGIVIDATTGKPIPHALVWAHPVGAPTEPKRLASAQTTADREGRFAFHNLDQYGYVLSVDDAEPVGTTHEKHTDGTITSTWPSLIEYHAGTGKDVTLQVVPR